MLHGPILFQSVFNWLVNQINSSMAKLLLNEISNAKHNSPLEDQHQTSGTVIKDLPRILRVTLEESSSEEL